MRVGILSDAHGNIRGTARCTEFFARKKVDSIIFLGDAVGYFPDPSATIEHLNQVASESLLGNHDAMLARLIEPEPAKAPVYNLERNRECVDPAVIESFKTRVPELKLLMDDKRVLFVHGSPVNPLGGYVYPDSPLDTFSDLNYDFIFMGHTHRPFIRKLANTTLINVGSCGLPRDCGNLASCAIFDTQSGSIEIFRLPFDSEALIGEIGEQVHFSVVDCLRRRTDNYFGTLVGTP